MEVKVEVKEFELSRGINFSYRREVKARVNTNLKWGVWLRPLIYKN